MIAIGIENCIHVIDGLTGQEVARIDHQKSRASVICFDAMDNLLAIALKHQKKVLIYNLQDKAINKSLNCTAPIASMAFIEKSPYLILGSLEKEIPVVDASNGLPVEAIKFSIRPTNIICSNSGTAIVVYYKPSILRIFQLRDLHNAFTQSF